LSSLSDGLDPPQVDYELLPRLREPHDRQREILDSPAKRRMIRAGRRGGKTTGSGIIAVKVFLNEDRVLCAAPTEDQISSFMITNRPAGRSRL